MLLIKELQLCLHPQGTLAVMHSHVKSEFSGCSGVCANV